MNFFSSDVFLESLARTRFARQKTDIQDFLCGGQRFRFLTVKGKPITRFPFLDFVEACVPADGERGGARPRALGYVPKAVVGRLPALGEKPSVLAPGEIASPLVDWTVLKTPAELDRHIKDRRSNLLSDSAKRERKMAAELGPVTFEYDDPRPDAFELAARWKAAQFVATGGHDWFFTENYPLFQELRRRGVLVYSTLRAGDRLVSAIWSGFQAGRLYYWVATYDPSLKQFSPGRLLVEKLLRESQRLGHREFDFLIGEEPYKWHYASHTRIVGPVGTAPLRLRAYKEARKRIKAALAGTPKLLDAAQSLRKRLRL